MSHGVTLLGSLADPPSRTALYESVTVPAGSFMAYKIVVAVGGKRFRQLWYAPETRTVVKSITYDPQGREVGSELVDYQKSDEPIEISKSQAEITPTSPGPAPEKVRPTPSKRQVRRA